MSMSRWLRIRMSDASLSGLRRAAEDHQMSISDYVRVRLYPQVSADLKRIDREVEHTERNSK